jgi:hypothetical protein
MDGMMDGDFDGVVIEVAHNMKNEPIKDKVEYEKLGFDKVFRMHEEELQRANNAIAAAGTPLSGVLGVLDSSSPTVLESSLGMDDPGAQGEEDKETTINAARRRFAEAKVDEAIALEVRCWQSEKLERIFKASGVVSGRVTRDGYHAWWWDAGVDCEPKAVLKTSEFSRRPLLDGPSCRSFFEVVMKHYASAHDGYLVGDAAVKANARDALKTLQTCKFSDEINICYAEAEWKEERAGGNIKLAECVHWASPHARRTLSRPRALYTLTSTASDYILQANVIPTAKLPRITVEKKQVILGEAGLVPTDKDADKSANVIFFHFEKDKRVWAEIIHHFNITSVTLGTVGSGLLLEVCLDNGIPCLALCKDEASLLAHIDPMLVYSQHSHDPVDTLHVVQCPTRKRVAPCHPCCVLKSNHGR